MSFSRFITVGSTVLHTFRVYFFLLNFKQFTMISPCSSFALFFWLDSFFIFYHNSVDNSSLVIFFPFDAFSLSIFLYFFMSVDVEYWYLDFGLAFQNAPFSMKQIFHQWFKSIQFVIHVIVIRSSSWKDYFKMVSIFMINI